MCSVFELHGKTLVCVGFLVECLNVINVKHCMKIVLCALAEHSMFISLSMTMTIFQSQGSVKQFQLNNLCSYVINLKLFIIVVYIN